MLESIRDTFSEILDFPARAGDIFHPRAHQRYMLSKRLEYLSGDASWRFKELSTTNIITWGKEGSYEHYETSFLNKEEGDALAQNLNQKFDVDAFEYNDKKNVVTIAENDARVLDFEYVVECSLARAVEEIGEEWRVEDTLRDAWNAQTSSDSNNWSEDNIAWGQCAVTACHVQERLGGDIVRVEFEVSDSIKGSHYFNVLDNGVRIDMTSGQFSEDTIFTPSLDNSNVDLLAMTREYIEKDRGFEGSTKDYILSYTPTSERYSLLQKNLA
jgi:hypothetical protein